MSEIRSNGIFVSDFATCSVSHSEHELKTNELHANANANGSVANEAKHHEPAAKKGEG